MKTNSFSQGGARFFIRVPSFINPFDAPALETAKSVARKPIHEGPERSSVLPIFSAKGRRNSNPSRHFFP
ncbi:MAG: hypothetical protein ABIV39_04995, partial [Verrucomicrobiota bacterium]